MCRIVPTVLNTLLAEGRFSAEDLASMAGVSANMIYRVRNEDAELNTSKVQSLSRELARQGDIRLARCFLTPDYEIVPRTEGTGNGRVDDDVTAIVQGLGSAVTAFARGDTAAMTAALTLIEEKFADLKAERDRL